MPNVFGGTANGLYVPLSDEERMALKRLVELNDIRLVIREWGYIDQPKVEIGEHSLHIPFRMTFANLVTPRFISWLDLSLVSKTTGEVYYAQRMATDDFRGQPLMVGDNSFLDLVWDIGLFGVSPELVKALVPSATGLTSKQLDRDTHEFSLFGNMAPTPEQKAALVTMAKGRDRLKRGLV